MPRVSAAPARTPRRAPQLELFPRAVDVEPLDPRRVVGERTRVAGIWRVRFGDESAPHRVFADRHGWYCEAHGRDCDAVSAARARAGDLPAATSARA